MRTVTGQENYIKDSTVEVLEYLDGWTKIRSGETEGYVPTEKLFTEDARIHSGEYEENTATVTADRLNVRAGTGTDTEVLTQVSEGETMKSGVNRQMAGIR